MSDIIIAAEDELSASIGNALILRCARGFSVKSTIITSGAGNLKSRLPAFMGGAAYTPFLVITDLDRSPCLLNFLTEFAGDEIPRGMLIRVAVREVESWIMADREGLADFLGVPRNKIPPNPDLEDDPKQRLVNIARKAKKKLGKGLSRHKIRDYQLGLGIIIYCQALFEKDGDPMLHKKTLLAYNEA